MSRRTGLGQRPRMVTFDGVIALLLGLIALGFGVVLVLAPMPQGFLFVPIGLFPAGFALRGRRDGRWRSAPVLPAIGAVTGLLGAVLIVVGMIRSALGG